MKSRAISVLIALIALATTALAQTTAGGSIRGRVLDSAGGAVVGAVIIATSPYTAGTFTATTDGSGDYRLIDLPPGEEYAIRATKEGFAPLSRTGIIIRAGLNNTLDLALQIGSVKAGRKRERRHTEQSGLAIYESGAQEHDQRRSHLHFV
jgi:hypothetical protein